MVNIKGDVIQWKAVKGTPPYVEAYKLTINVRSITDERPTFRNTHTISMELPAAYPRVAPQIIMLTTPPPFHPNWYQVGKWCFGTWDISEGLGHHVIRMIRTLQFDLEITNPDSPANGEANRWFCARRNSGIFPCDSTPLPDPTKSRFSLQSQTKRKFKIN
ncbi:MAG: hypothetical protein AAFR59_14095 [Bacteroidota bacterium]